MKKAEKLIGMVAGGSNRQDEVILLIIQEVYSSSTKV